MKLDELRSSPFSQAPHFLLVGNPVSQSLSPLMHNTAAEYYGIETRYGTVELQSSELSSFASYLNNKHLKGVNITIPYKQLIMEYVDELSRDCREIGAMNTIKKDEHRLVGYNTDVYGFLNPLESIKEEIESKGAIIFGTGGASKAIVYALNQWLAERIVVVSRDPGGQSQSDWNGDPVFCSYDAWPVYAEDAGLIVNATPLGMAPNEKRSPLKDNEKAYLKNKICYDIVYKPLKTPFLKIAEEVNARTIGGLEMLIHQGSRSFELWTGHPFPLDHVRTALNEYLANED